MENTTVFLNDSYEHHLHLHDSDSQEARVASLTFLVLNAAVSLVGNSLSLAVFTRSRFRGAPSSGYLASLAVADTGSAVTAALGIAFSMYGTSSTFFFCNVVFFLSYVFQFLAVWLMVCFTAERYVSVCHPLRSRLILSKCREYQVVIVHVVVACGIYSPNMFSAKTLHFETHLQKWTCDWSDGMKDRYAGPFAYVTFFSHFVVPMAVIGLLNTLIVYKLCRTSGSANLGAQASKERDAVNRHITVTLLLVCLVFFLCHFPFNLIYLLTMVNVKVDKWLYLISQMLFKVTYSSNFFLYALSGTQFRTSLKSLFGLDRAREEH